MTDELQRLYAAGVAYCEERGIPLSAIRMSDCTETFGIAFYGPLNRWIEPALKVLWAPYLKVCGEPIPPYDIRLQWLCGPRIFLVGDEDILHHKGTSAYAKTPPNCNEVEVLLPDLSYYLQEMEYQQSVAAWSSPSMKETP